MFCSKRAQYLPMRNLFILLSVALPLICSAASRQAQAVAIVVQGFVSGITVTDGGAGYRSAPAVRLSGGGGAGASAVAILEADRVRQIVVTSAGSDYSQAPSVSVEFPPDPHSGLQKLWEIETHLGEYDEWHFGSDTSALAVRARDMVWVSTNGVFMKERLRVDSPRLITANKAIFLGFVSTNSSSKPVFCTLERTPSNTVSVTVVELTDLILREGDDPWRVFLCQPGPNSTDSPASRRDCFCVVYRGETSHRTVAFRILDPDLQPRLTIGPASPARPDLLTLAVNNTSGDRTEIQSSPDFQVWQTLLTVENSTQPIHGEIPIKANTNLFLRAMER